MEIRSSYRIENGKKKETKEIYFDPNEIRIDLNAEEKDVVEAGIEADFDTDYFTIKGEELKGKNVFKILAELFQKASEYVEQGWSNVGISIRTIGEHSLAIGFRNTGGAISPIWADIIISVEEINKDCSEKLTKIREILDKKRLINGYK